MFFYLAQGRRVSGPVVKAASNCFGETGTAQLEAAKEATDLVVRELIQIKDVSQLSNFTDVKHDPARWSIMLRILIVSVVLSGTAACDQQTAPSSTTSEVDEDAGAGFIVDGPTEAVGFACADGRQVMVRAFMGGVIVSVDGQSYEMPQISVPDGARGYYHQLGDLGWFEDENWNGHLITIGPGQTILTAPEVFCERVGPMWWELDDSNS